jgi:nucleotidyltransferase/DNA polymerase involved in DNA repair
MTNSSQKNHAFIYGDKRYSRNVHYDRSCNAYDSNAMFASSSSIMHDRSLARKNVIHHVPRRNVRVPRKINEPSTIYHACNASFEICRKDRKVIARKLGAKCKGDKTCIWIPNTIVTNLVGPNKSWVPKTQA